jgi:DNA excision repair protein ERCC-5
MRDADGNTIHNAHLKGLWGRICKLLVFGMKPVFVFDGAPPLLKTETLIARRRARRKAEGDLQRIAERILLNQLKLSTIAQAKQLLKEGKLELAEKLKLGLSGALTVMEPVPKTEEEELVEETPLEVEALDQSVSELDRSNAQDETSLFVKSFTAEELRSIEADGNFVSDLPRETQMALLSEMKAAHRGHVGNLSLTSPTRLTGTNYSHLQMEQLVQKGEISRRLETVRGEFNSENYRPIASDPRVRYRLTPVPTTPLKSFVHNLAPVTSSDASSSPQPRNTSSLTSSSQTSRSPSSQMGHTGSVFNKSTQSTDQGSLAPRSVPRFSQHPTSSQAQLIISQLSFADPEIVMIDMISDSEDEDAISDDGGDDSGSSEDSFETPYNSPIKHSLSSAQRPTITTIPVFAEEDEFDDVEFEDISSSMNTQEVTSQRVLTPSSSILPALQLPVHPNITEKVESFAPASPTQSFTKQTHQPENISSESVIPALPVHTDTFGAFVEDEEDVLDFSEPFVPRSDDIMDTFVRGSDGGAFEEQRREMMVTGEPIKQVSEWSEKVVKEMNVHPTSVSMAESSRTISFGTELDVSTESQRVPSVNQSFVSEEELQRSSLHSFEDLEVELQREVAMLEGEARQGQNQAVTLTSEAVDEAKELLRLFGIPFIQSPSEADAQCAALQCLGLVDGIVTDDSDILVFGGDTVFRYAFSQHHELELYNMEDVKTELGIDHDGLIFLALLLGGDYADGIKKVGPKAALDIVTEFPGPQGIYQFKSWLSSFQNGREEYDMILVPPSASFIKKYKKLLQTMVLPASFPNPSVLDAYQNPPVDNSKEPFSWGWPNLAGLRQFALDKFGWTRERVDTNLLPVIQIYTAALSDTQPKIETFFTQVSIHGNKSKSSSSKSSSGRRKRTSPSQSDDPKDSGDKISGKSQKKRPRSSMADALDSLFDSSTADLLALDDPPAKKSKPSEAGST